MSARLVRRRPMPRGSSAWAMPVSRTPTSRAFTVRLDSILARFHPPRSRLRSWRRSSRRCAPTGSRAGRRPDMKFGDTPIADAAGAILAHNLKLGGRVFRKGRTLIADDIAALSAAGIANVVVARLEPGDVGEDEAANRIAGRLTGAGITAAPAFTGRANLFAEMAGLCRVDRAAVNRLNAIDEAITLATLEPDTVVAPKQMVATVKIIPFAVAGERLAACDKAVAEAARPIAVAPFAAKRAMLIQTELPGLKPSVLDKTVEITRARLTALGGSLIGERRVQHDTAALVPAIKTALADGADLVLVAGASAILDRRDVIPAAVEAAGGTVLQFGMPV